MFNSIPIFVIILKLNRGVCLKLFKKIFVVIFFFILMFSGVGWGFEGEKQLETSQLSEKKDLSEDGWYSVDRPEKMDTFEKTDPKLWVSFSKTLQNEKLIIQFPVEPTYHYIHQEIEISAEKNGIQYFLQTMKDRVSENWVNEYLNGKKSLEINKYQKGEMDVVEARFEKNKKVHMCMWIFSKDRTYFLQQISPDSQISNHKFFNSVDIEKFVKS